MKFKLDLDNNPLALKWDERLEKLDDETKRKLDELDNCNPDEYQLKVIKRKRIKPCKGDVFIVNTYSDVFYYGIVINSGISNINGEELSVIFILKDRVEQLGKDELDITNLLIEPAIVTKAYWSRGYFYNIGEKIEIPADLDYGFYYISRGMYVNEYGKEINRIPQILGGFGMLTMTGIAYEINCELIISGSDTMLDEESN